MTWHRMPDTEPPPPVRDFSVERLRNLFESRKNLMTFWRHDVDVSLEAARRMVSVEFDHDVQATYFVMTDSDFYTADEAMCFASYATDGGHRIGWHIDPRITPPHMVSDIAYQARVSWHCPRAAELWKRFPQILSAYDPVWEGRYFADSRGRFAHGDPEDWADPAKAIQVSLHPEWWFDPAWPSRITDRDYEQYFHEPKERLL